MQRYRSQDIHPIGGVKANPFSNVCEKFNNVRDIIIIPIIIENLLNLMASYSLPGI